MIRNHVSIGFRAAWLSLLVLPLAALTTAAAPKVPVAPKWSRFELTFKSGLVYTNPLQEATLTVTFKSPLGRTLTREGFWDGGRTWRVRFTPDQPGRWTFKTSCSDKGNAGLDDQAGEFLCSAPLNVTPFQKHGPVRLARDQRHFEHADGTPFFWMADTTWNGPRLADAKDWRFYAITRGHQGFSAVQWAGAPGQDSRQQSAWTGFPEQIGINVPYFRRLDEKLDLLTHAGLMSVICPLLELPPASRTAPALPDTQAELLVRYMVARWGADPVAWVLAFDSDAAGKSITRWKRIGWNTFGSSDHGPVILYSGETQWVLDEFRDQKWVDAFGYQSVTDTTEDALKWTFSGPFVGEWQKGPPRALIPFLPCDNGPTPRSGKRFSSADVRRAAYWSLLLSPPAGLSYSAQGVTDWDISVGAKATPAAKNELPLWHKALFMDGAKQMSILAQRVTAIDYWQLRPDPDAVAKQPGQDTPARYISAAVTEARSLCLAYTPEAGSVELQLKEMPRSPAVNWLNPRTGEVNPAVAVVSDSSCQFPTPGPGDWLLQLKAGK